MSNMDWAKTILNRLSDGKPLTPIEDIDDEFVYSETIDNFKLFSSIRRPSLIKCLRPDGGVFYFDNDRCVGIDINSGTARIHSNLIDVIVDCLCPITMPYWPDDDPIKVYFEDFCAYNGDGYYDTRCFMYLIHPSKGRLPVNRYFKYDDNQPVEIDLIEYIQRKEIAEERLRSVK